MPYEHTQDNNAQPECYIYTASFVLCFSLHVFCVLTWFSFYLMDLYFILACSTVTCVSMGPSAPLTITINHAQLLLWSSIHVGGQFILYCLCSTAVNQLIDAFYCTLQACMEFTDHSVCSGCFHCHSDRPSVVPM